MDNLNNPIVFGIVAAVITYFALQSDKQEEKRRLSFKYSILVGLMVWFVGYYFYNPPMIGGGTIVSGSPVQDILTDRPTWN